MDYEALTTDKRIALLDRWIAKLEEEHFTLGTNMKNADVQKEAEANPAWAGRKVDLEASIERMRRERDELKEHKPPEPVGE